jgi:hypothetical protein
MGVAVDKMIIASVALYVGILVDNGRNLPMFP